MEEFKNFNIHSLMRILNKSDYEFEQWLKEKYLCWTIRFCECGRQMTLKKSKIWQCGRNLVVEIDETVVCKPKYNRGRDVAREEQWFFGGVQGLPGKAFMEPLDRRNAATPLPILQKYVEQESGRVSKLMVLLLAAIHLHVKLQEWFIRRDNFGKFE
uniref:DDE_Tnp_1_7 domain-containing protein n=1 Tax=Meloidogyne hapla TaxID=6305 RepID=A0A1I8B8H2_MELHA